MPPPDEGSVDEEVELLLRANEPTPRASLARTMRGLGMTPEDDFFVLNREVSGPAWQSEEVLSLDVRLSLIHI